MQYELIYDAAQAGYRNRYFPLFGFLVLIPGLIMSRFMRKRIENKRQRFHRFFTRFYIGFCLFWIAAAFLGTYSDYVKVRNALNAKQYEIVEGKVTKFVPMPAQGHAMESFVVNGKKFEYSDFVVSAGFNNSSSHGGPIKAGLQVRIANINGKIGRLEIAIPSWFFVGSSFVWGNGKRDPDVLTITAIIMRMGTATWL